MQHSRAERLVAATIAIVAATLVAVFRGRIAPDFWPLDRSYVGPNLLASACIAAPAFVAGVLAAPYARRAAHRFVDMKLAPLHARHQEHHELLERLIEQLQQQHAINQKPAAARRDEGE